MQNRAAWKKEVMRGLAGLALCAVAYAAPETPSVAEAMEDKPNIVFILVDDMGWKDLGCYGSTFYETPHIDRLAESGVRFTDAYAAAPLCSASRAAILTGWSPARQHLIGVTPHSRGKYGGFKDYESWRAEPEYRFSKMPLRLSKQLGQLCPDRSITIAERLKEKGYATAFIGKWHLGPDADKFPEKHGFDINIAGSHFGWPNSYFSPYSIPNLTDGNKGEYLTDRLTDEALGWLETQHRRKKPFFLYLSHFAVHGPWQSKDEYTEYFESKADANDKQRNPAYAGMIRSLDDSVGRLMDRLSRLGIEKDTLVILASDNGGIAMEKKCRVTGRVAEITSMHPLRGEKALLYEGGVRVPCIISMPGTVQVGTTSREPVNSVDFYPTILELAGLTKKEGNPLDGQSLLAHVKSGASLNRDTLTWFMPARIKAGEGMDPCASIRHGNYKYIKFFVGRQELYDLSQDIGETRNLAASKPDLCEKLDAMLMADLKRKNAHIPIKNPAYKDPATASRTSPSRAAIPAPAPVRAKSDGFYTVVCPRMFVVEIRKPGPWLWQKIEDYIPTITNPSNWPDVLKRTDSLKLYITPLTNDKLHKDGDAYRRQIADLVSKTGIDVCVEVGGSRDGGGTPKLGDQAGEFSARKDQARLQKWLATPGAKLDAIVTDHAVMWYIREQTQQDVPLLIQEYVDYVVEMKKWRPGLKVGMIESLGYFKIDRDGKTYPQTDKRLFPLEFHSFLKQVLAEAEKRNVTIDFFDVDFGFMGVSEDSRRANPNWDWRNDPADHGRIFEAEAICRDLGVDVGVICNDRLNTEGFKKLGINTIEEADIECGKRNVAFIRGYMAAGGKPERMIFQSWMTHPTTTGPETVEHSFMGITKRQLDVAERSKRIR